MEHIRRNGSCSRGGPGTADRHGRPLGCRCLRARDRSQLRQPDGAAGVPRCCRPSTAGNALHLGCHQAAARREDPDGGTAALARLVATRGGRCAPPEPLRPCRTGGRHAGSTAVVLRGSCSPTGRVVGLAVRLSETEHRIRPPRSTRPATGVASAPRLTAHTSPATPSRPRRSPQSRRRSTRSPTHPQQRPDHQVRSHNERCGERTRSALRGSASHDTGFAPEWRRPVTNQVWSVPLMRGTRSLPLSSLCGLRPLRRSCGHDGEAGLGLV